MQEWWGSSVDEVGLHSSLEAGTWTGRVVLDLQPDNKNPLICQRQISIE